MARCAMADRSRAPGRVERAVALLKVAVLAFGCAPGHLSLRDAVSQSRDARPRTSAAGACPPDRDHPRRTRGLFFKGASTQARTPYTTQPSKTWAPPHRLERRSAGSVPAKQGSRPSGGFAAICGCLRPRPRDVGAADPSGEAAKTEQRPEISSPTATRAPARTPPERIKASAIKANASSTRAPHQAKRASTRRLTLVSDRAYDSQSAGLASSTPPAVQVIRSPSMHRGDHKSGLQRMF